MTEYKYSITGNVTGQLVNTYRLDKDIKDGLSLSSAVFRGIVTKDDDLYVNISVPLATAMLGGEVQVPTLKGTKLALRIPSETQNERVFRLTGQGMPRIGDASRGDLLVTIKVILPAGLSAEEKALFSKLRELRPG